MKIYPDAPEKRNSCTLANKVLTFDELAQKYEDTANTVDNITNDNGQIDGDTIDGIYSRQVIDLEDGIINSVYIQELNTKYVQVSGKLDAVEIETGSIKGNVAEFEETYTKKGLRLQRQTLKPFVLQISQLYMARLISLTRCTQILKLYFPDQLVSVICRTST